MRPFCSSTKCIGSQTKPAVEKNISGKPLNCPDCGHALVWGKNRSKLRFARNNKNKKVKSYLGNYL